MLQRWVIKPLYHCNSDTVQSDE